MYEVLNEFDEQSIIDICLFAGRAANFDEPYEVIEEGSEITLWVEASEYYDEAAYRLKLIALKAGVQALEGSKGSPSNKMFQAEIIRTTAPRLMGEPAEDAIHPYGILFPNGFASIVDNNAR